jgi:hypothetical protein
MAYEDHKGYRRQQQRKPSRYPIETSLPGAGEAVDQQRQAGCGGQSAAKIEPRRIPCWAIGAQCSGRNHQGHGRDRHIDRKDPAPPDRFADHSA